MRRSQHTGERSGGPAQPERQTHRGSSAWLLAAVTLALLVGIAPSPSAAHSWYPKKCCNEIDCRPVDSIEHRSDGTMIMHAGPFDVVVPSGFPARPSLDNQAHVCVFRDIFGRYHPRCVFLPGTS